MEKDMFSDEYFDIAINRVIELVGIRDHIRSDTLESLIHKKKFKECIKDIAKYLGLPVEINIEFVAKGEPFDKFQSTTLVNTNRDQNDPGGIIAQVMIPTNLPMYGSNSLINYPIKVLMHEDCIINADSAIAVFAHEMAHILLKTLGGNLSDNECYAELVPICLGFSNIVKLGRKTVESREEMGVFNNRVITTTSSFGYLSDKQFSKVSERVSELLIFYKEKKTLLGSGVGKLKRNLIILRKMLQAFNLATSYLQNSNKLSMPAEDSKKIVSLYNLDNLSSTQRMIEKNTERLAKLEMYQDTLVLYTAGNLATLEKNTLNTTEFNSTLNREIQIIKNNIKLIKKYLEPLSIIKLMIRTTLWSSKSEAI